MKRNRRAGVEDRWTKTVRDAHGNATKVPTAPGTAGGCAGAHGMSTTRVVSTRKRSRRKADAQSGWTPRSPPKLATGTYVRRGRAW